jgi:hypothetical protein
LSVTITLTDEKALVLYDYLARCSDAEKLLDRELPESRVFWDLEAMLEAKLNAVLSPDYKTVLAQARASLIAGEGR